MADLRFRARHDPEANGRTPMYGETRWTIHMMLDNGDVLYIHLGKKDRDILFGMLIADCQDSGEEEPQ